MSKRIFNKEQIETLLQNENVDRCSEKSICYRKDFKILAIRKYRDGISPNEIFRIAEFDIKMIGCDTPHECIRRWLKKGETELKTDGRGQSKSGGRPKSIEAQITGMTEKEKIEYLETQVAYLKAENDFLAKLRKKSLN